MREMQLTKNAKCKNAGLTQIGVLTLYALKTQPKIYSQKNAAAN